MPSRSSRSFRRRPTSSLYRLAIGSFGVVMAVAALAGSSADAQEERSPEPPTTPQPDQTEPRQIPEPDGYYEGLIAYKPRGFGMNLQVSSDGRSVRVTPGYTQGRDRCGVFRDIFSGDMQSPTQLRISESKRFSGTGKARTTVNSEQGIVLRASWRVTGRFSGDRASGRLRMSVTLQQGKGPRVACPVKNVTWRAELQTEPTNDPSTW